MTLAARKMASDDTHPEFPQDPGVIYLNHAAVSPWPRRSCEAVKAYADENLRFGARDYPLWERRERQLRQKLQKLINAPSEDDIALVKNTSEAISLIASGLEWKAGDNIVSTNLEFPSNRIPWEALQSSGVEFREADVLRSMEMSPEEAIMQAVDERTRLVTVSSIQFSNGLALDLERLGEFCSARGVLFAIDAIQSIGARQFDVQAYRADFVMADGHKWMLGPEGLGVFFSTPKAREGLRLHQFGWHMVEKPGDYDSRTWAPAQSARRFECGSPNNLGIVALSASLDLLLEVGMPTIEKRLMQRSEYLRMRIANRTSLDLLTPAGRHGQSGITTFSCRNRDNHEVLQGLKANGVVCSVRGGGLRFSPHFYTPFEQIDCAFDLVCKLD